MSTLKKRKIDWSISSFCHRSITQTLQLEPSQVSPVHTLKILATTFCRKDCVWWLSFFLFWDYSQRPATECQHIFFEISIFQPSSAVLTQPTSFVLCAKKKGSSTENALCNWLDHPHNSDHLQKMLLCWTVLFATCRLIHIIQIICKKCQFKWALLHFTLAHYAT